ncbi:hypothetical protein [Candidatus Nitrosocosmicus hydrocola]|uniref:hypothetical protein n=1 Tax=Candidatus Nitrosocosmicus hydrocola TaxID=1826872 RepID=UPI000AB32621|nr:hypothetical protein [Candidatus Nitrosocosmicus hydrocola]
MFLDTKKGKKDVKFARYGFFGIQRTVLVVAINSDVNPGQQGVKTNPIEIILRLLL